MSENWFILKWKQTQLFTLWLSTVNLLRKTHVRTSTLILNWWTKQTDHSNRLAGIHWNYKHTMMFEAITLGSSHTDSMKKICERTDLELVVFIRSSYFLHQHYLNARIKWPTLKPFLAPKSRIMSRLCLVVFVASKTCTVRMERICSLCMCVCTNKSNEMNLLLQKF